MDEPPAGYIHLPAPLPEIDALVEAAESGDDEAFAGAARTFCEVFASQAEARGLAGHNPFALLAELERLLAQDPSLGADRAINYAAAVATIRQYLMFCRAGQASLN